MITNAGSKFLGEFFINSADDVCFALIKTLKQYRATALMKTEVFCELSILFGFRSDNEHGIALNT